MPTITYAQGFGGFANGNAAAQTSAALQGLSASGTLTFNPGLNFQVSNGTTGGVSIASGLLPSATFTGFTGRHITLSAYTGETWAIRTSSADLSGVRLNQTANTFSLLSAGTVIASGASFGALGGVTYVDILQQWSAGVMVGCNIYHNANLILSWTGSDSNNKSNYVFIGQPAANALNVQHSNLLLYTPTSLTDPIGPSVISTGVPTANGATNEGTNTGSVNAWENLDDTIAAMNPENNYTSHSSANQTDLFTTNVSIPTGRSMKGVFMRIVGRTAATGQVSQVAALHRTSGGVVTENGTINITDQWAGSNSHQQISMGSSFSDSDINSGQFGFRRKT